MSNAFVPMTEVVAAASLFLKEKPVIPFVTNRGLVQEKFATKNTKATVKKVGNVTVSNVVPGATITAVDIAESSVDVNMNRYLPARMVVNPQEHLVNIDDTMRQIVIPALDGIATAIETYGIPALVGGFNGNLVGTAGNSPSTLAHIAAAEKKIFDNKGNVDNLVGVFTSTAYSSLAQLAVNTSTDYKQDGPNNLALAKLGALSGIKQSYRSRLGSVNAFDRGYLTGTIVTNGAASAGATSLPIDGFTAATGTMYQGLAFTVTGSTARHVLVADATIAGNATTLSIWPALTGNVSDGATLTFEAAPTNNVIFDPNAVAAVILPPPPGENSVLIGGADAPYQVRLTTSPVSTSTGGMEWLFDVFFGLQVVERYHGCVVQG